MIKYKFRREKRSMTDVKAKAIELINELSDDKVIYIIQILQSLKGLYGQTDSTMSNDWNKEKAFESLEKLRKKIPELDYEKELAESREERYANIN